jgi:DNA-binding NarL/FixJ family response regulator
MDLSLHGQNGIEGTEQTLRACPGARVVILSAYSDERSVTDAIRAGARGFVIKRASRGDLFDAIRAVASGSVYLSQEVSQRLIAQISSGVETTPAMDCPTLTPRERQVLRMIAEGKSSKDIASEIGLSPETVRSYRKAMMKKLGVHNVAGLTQLAISNGIVDRFERASSARV